MLAANTYSVTQVCPTNVNQLCELHGVNSNGAVVGGITIAVADTQEAFVNTNGIATAIAHGIGVAINDSGQVAGVTGQFFPGVPFSYLYSDGIVTELTHLSGFDATWVTGINDTGQMVGYAASNADPGTIQAFSYSNGVMTPLGLLPAGTKSWANGINDGGVIVGYGTNALGHLEAFVYRDGAMIGLGTLPGYTDSVATAISDEGDVVGYAIDAASRTQAFLYSGGAMKGLGTLPGYIQSRALAINHFGDVVGVAIGDSATDPERAFLYTHGQMYDLNSLIQAGQDTLSRATGINLFGQIVADGHAGSYLLTPVKGQYVPVMPCRIADTRTSNGPFGGPQLDGVASRSFAIPQSACNIPATALAYSLNVTAVPRGPLGFLSLWPDGMAQPVASTLNSWLGTVVANAAIVAAGQGGAVSVFASNPTDVILDINGYFDSAAGDPFYPTQPCRVDDTRGAAGPLGGPALSSGETRSIPVLSSSCGLPSTATAYSMNVTVVPSGYLGFLTAWADGQPQPFVSTLNSWMGNVVANAAIVPAGANGATSVFVTNPTDVILDVNGYFAPPGGTAGLAFYPVVPCRLADTRNPDGPFGGPEMEAGTTRSFTVPAGGCGIPQAALAYSLNVTVVPDGPLFYLTAWPAGAPQPNASTLNSFEGSVVANAAIVRAGALRAISVYVTNRTHLVLDIDGYFAP